MEDDGPRSPGCGPALEAAKNDFRAPTRRWPSGSAACSRATDEAGVADRERFWTELAQVVGTRGYLRRVLTNLARPSPLPEKP
jgi:hypothetical protein